MGRGLRLIHPRQNADKWKQGKHKHTAARLVYSTSCHILAAAGISSRSPARRAPSITVLRTYSVMDHSTRPVTNWAAYLNGLAPCRFGRGSHSHSHSHSHNQATTRRAVSMSARVQVEPVRVAGGAEELAAVLRTSWALLLRCYTGQDDVGFWFQCGGGSAGSAGSAATRPPVVARFCLDDSASISGAVQRSRVELAGDLPRLPEHLVQAGGEPLLDSSVVVWEVDDKARSCPVLPAVRDPSQALPFVADSTTASQGPPPRQAWHRRRQLVRRMARAASRSGHDPRPRGCPCRRHPRQDFVRRSCSSGHDELDVAGPDQPGQSGPHRPLECRGSPAY